MKKKKLKKLLKKTLNDFSIDKKVDRQFDVKESETATGMNIEFTETDDDTKNKMRSLIIRLLKIRDKVNFHSTDNNIHLNREINNKGINGLGYYIYFRIDITKGSGVLISITGNGNEKKVLLKDENLFDDIKPKIKSIFDEINRNNFSDIHNILLKENGLIRESNLDDLLTELAES